MSGTRRHIKFPMPFTVQVNRRTQDGVDSFGDPIYVTVTKDVRCSGWAEPAPEELISGNATERREYELNAYVEAGHIRSGETVTVDGTDYRCIGVGNYNSGPWAYTDLEVLKLKKAVG